MVTKIKPWGSPTIQSDSDVGAYNILFQDIIPGSIVPIEYVSTIAPVVPSEALLGSLRDGRLKVHSPIKVRFATEGKHTIAEAVEIDEFGFGKNVSEAIADLQRTIAELYFTLEKEQGHLGKDLRSVWAILQKKIHKR